MLAWKHQKLNCYHDLIRHFTMKGDRFGSGTPGCRKQPFKEKKKKTKRLVLETTEVFNKLDEEKQWKPEP